MSKGPEWMRIDVDIMSNPKIAALRQARKYEPLCLYIDMIGYSTRNLTEGWVPPRIPRSHGYRARDIDTLIEYGLWHAMEIADIGGWLIHDYLDHNPTKAWWERRTEQRRNAARARWER